MKTPLLIGLTGSIASGKSTALGYFEKLGAAVLSADEIVRALYQRPSVRRQLETWFGSAQPAHIAQCVFADRAAREKLEAFLHPLIWKEMQARIKKIHQGCAVLELPLLFEAGWENRVDVTVLVAGGEKVARARLAARGLSLQEYKRRLRNQLPQTEKIKRADICILNDKTPRELAEKIVQLYRAFKQIYHF